jgi:hypothetical protein
MSERPSAGYPGAQRAGQEPSQATATREGDGGREAPGTKRRERKW